MKMSSKLFGFFPLLLIAGTSIGQVTVNANTIKGFFKKKTPPKDTAQTASTSSAATGKRRQVKPLPGLVRHQRSV